MNNKKILREFKDALKRGVGKAYQIAKTYPSLNLSPLILKACLVNPDYDPQCSDHRAVSLCELVNLRKDASQLKRKIISKYISMKEDLTYGQISVLVKMFAKEGDKRARKAIYDNFRCELKEGWLPEEAYHIIELDRFQGLIYVVKTTGRFMLKRKVSVGSAYEHSMLTMFRNKRIKGDVNVCARKDKDITRFLESVKREVKKDKKKYSKKPNVNYERIMKLVNTPKGVPMFWGKYLSKKDIARVATLLKETRDRKCKENLLKLFAHCKYPYESSDLTALAFGKNKRLAHFALMALKHFKGKQFRAVAVENLKRNRCYYAALELLLSRLEKGDGKLMQELLAKVKNHNDFHTIVLVGRDFLDALPKGVAANIAMETYRKNYCGNCKEKVVKSLLKMDRAPRWLLKEALYDSSLYVRKNVKRYCTVKGIHL